MSDYWGRDRFTQAEKKQEVIRDTFLNRAEGDASLEAQGRFKKQNETRVVGSSSPTYPTITSGPWSQGDPGAPDAITNELGYDINQVEPVEERSLAAATPDNSGYLRTSVAVDQRGQGESDDRPNDNVALSHNLKRSEASSSSPGSSDRGVGSSFPPIGAAHSRSSPKPWRRF